MDQHKTRHLKLQEEHRPRAYKSSRVVPSLKLSGVWLEESGFRIGQTAEVTVKSNELIIRVQNETDLTKT